MSRWGIDGTVNRPRGNMSRLLSLIVLPLLRLALRSVRFYISLFRSKRRLSLIMFRRERDIDDW